MPWSLLLAILLAAGCSGSQSRGVDEPPPAEEVAKSRLEGSWVLRPEDKGLRRLKIIDAAMSGRPDRKAALGKLADDEEALFETWLAKTGEAARAMRAQLRFLGGATFTFTEEEVSLRFGTDGFGPVAYSVVESSDARTVIQLDPGLGTGLETHRIEWKTANRGTAVITTASHGEFAPLRMLRQ